MVADEPLGAGPSVGTATYLAHAVAATHESHWVPAASTDAQPTWRAARDRLERGADLTPADIHRAHEIVGWAASLRPRHPDSYRARMAACLAHMRLTPEQLPLAASAVRAFNLHLYYEIRGRKSRQDRPSVDELRDHAEQFPAIGEVAARR
jgi:hypothetical protein